MDIDGRVIDAFGAKGGRGIDNADQTDVFVVLVLMHCTLEFLDDRKQCARTVESPFEMPPVEPTGSPLVIIPD